MSEPTVLPKAVREPVHQTYIINSASGDFHAVRCEDCPDWESPEFDGRRYLAEMAATEHQRAMANWPGTVPSPAIAPAATTEESAS
jgi:hypothetical protein